jgi:DNA-binding response OmpR family regulator
VLIVEDDKAARTAISRILKMHAFTVSEAATIAEAMAALVDPPAWILLDLMLPDGCGIEVLKSVRGDRLRCKVCVITGCGAELLEEARTAGAEHAFTKPLDVERLMEVMRA